VVSATEMYDACNRLFPECHIAVLSAAVADFRPAERAGEKIKKGEGDTMQLTLVKNPDILAHLGSIKQAHQVLAGFALETSDELENARHKLERKNADMIVLNSLRDEGAGFGTDTNKVSILQRDGTVIELPLQHKREIAKSIVDCILSLKEKDA